MDLREIIEERIVPKPSLKEVLGFGRAMRIPISSFTQPETLAILENFPQFKAFLSERIEASIPAAFPGIRIKLNNGEFYIEIGDPSPRIAAEWKWK
ncbi:hypothetical protein J7K42_01785 [bacterium]|nr:hypothetical protein [bacterium]